MKNKLSKEARRAGFTQNHVKQMAEFLRELTDPENRGKVVHLKMMGKTRKRVNGQS